MADKVIVIRGVLDWAKVLGPAKPHTGLPKYDKGPAWSVDITPDAESRKVLKAMGVDDDKFRKAKGEKDKRTETFISLKVLENKKDGTKNKPPVVKDIHGNLWNPDIEIGNGTVADVKVSFADYGDTQGLYLKAIRVLKLVPYERDEDFEELSADDEFFAAAETPTVDDDAPVIDEAAPETPETDTPDGDEDDVPF